MLPGGCNMERLEKHSWELAARGGVAVLFGILAIGRPARGVLGLMLGFAVWALVDGILAMYAAGRAISDERPWGSLALETFAGVGAGLLTLLWPALGAVALVVLIGSRALIVGVTEIAEAIRIRGAVRGGWLLGISGVLSTIFGIVLIARPTAAAVALIWTIGIYALSFGASWIALSIEVATAVRAMHHEHA